MAPSFLTARRDPAFAITPPLQHSTTPPARPPTGLAARVADLEARLTAAEVKLRELYGWSKHAIGITRAVRRAVRTWPGEFTARDIFDLVARGGTQISVNALSQRLMHLERRGAIRCTQRGAGPVPNRYEASAGENTGVGLPRGRHHPNTSGLIIALRGALSDLPAEFSLADVRAWLAAHWRGKKPQSINTYLYALRDCDEIEVARPQKRGTAGHCQLYRRTQKIIAVNGDALAPAEIAWREFRKTLKTDVPEIHCDLERDNGEI